MNELSFKVDGKALKCVKKDCDTELQVTVPKELGYHIDETITPLKCPNCNSMYVYKHVSPKEREDSVKSWHHKNGKQVGEFSSGDLILMKEGSS